MPPSTFLGKFPGELRRWAGHCSLNAAPSFGIAFIWLRLRTFESIAAMVCAVFTFIIGYALLTSFGRPLSDRDHPIGRALRVGLMVRGWISALSCLCLALAWFFIFSPDAWCGALAISIVERLYKDLLHRPFDLETSPPVTDFFGVYLTTLLEGLLLSVLLFSICFISLIVIQTLLRRRTIPSNWLLPPKKPGLPDAD